MGKIFATIALAAALAAAGDGPRPTSAAQAPVLTLVNVQLVEVDQAATVLRVQSSGAQAFDRLKTKNPRQVLVRFYRAKTGDLPAFDQPAFGSVSFSQEKSGSVLLTINLASSAYTAAVVQGGNPNTVEIRVRR